MVKVEHHQLSKYARTFYDGDYKKGYCSRCEKEWKPEEQIMYTTQNQTRTYGICPNPECGDKRPLRKRPRTRDAWRKKYPKKYI